MRTQAAADGLPPGDWEGSDGMGNPARVEMLRQVAMLQAQARRN